MSTQRRRRIAICGPSSIYAAQLRSFLERDEELEVVGSYGNGEDLITALDRVDPDLVMLDLDIPGTGGLGTIQAIMRDHPLPILAVSAEGGRNTAGASRALAAGALEAIHKERLGVGDPDDIWATALRSRIKLLASSQLRRRVRGPRRVAGPRPQGGLSRPARAIAVGASAGGPPALLGVLQALPADYPLPVLVVQHIASGFAGSLAKWLDRRVDIPVGFAEEGEKAGPGVWFAPDDAHLVLEPTMLFSFDRVTPGPHRPSLDVLFDSVASAAGDKAVGVVLTGMGRDGAAGVKAIRAVGGRAIAQDEQSSAVFGMPRAAVEGGAGLVLPLDEIGRALSRLAPERSAVS